MGLIANIQRFALHDGPGIRTTVFLKGCPLNCAWCQNPEALSPQPQILFTSRLCSNCRSCERVCPQGVHVFDAAGHRVAFGQCAQCGQCVAACPNEALVIVGQEMSVEDVIGVARKDKDYYDQSGGGVTLSGGEPLAQAEFALSTLRACAREGIHTALDTSGYAAPEVFDPFIAAADLFLFDLKAADEGRHRRVTGAGAGWILRNLREAVARGANVLVRVPLVPGRNDGEEELDRMAGIVAGLPARTPVQFLPFHDYAKHKYEALGMAYRMPPETRRPARKDLETAKAIFANHVLDVIEEV